VRERDLAGEDRIVVGHIGLRVVATVLELDVHAGAEELDVEQLPVDADLVADAPGFLERRLVLCGHHCTSVIGGVIGCETMVATLRP
jgi:hypothetical protein